MAGHNSRNLVTRSLLIVGTLAAAVVIGMSLYGRTPLDRRQAASTLDELLTGIYRSFDETDEKAVYRRLADSVTGEQITQIYLEHRRALEAEERGGARARVDGVDVVSIRGLENGDSGRLVIDATWTVSGSVDHFGHTHQRRNRYDARVTIVPVDGQWKIEAIDVADHQREL